MDRKTFALAIFTVGAICEIATFTITRKNMKRQCEKLLREANT